MIRLYIYAIISASTLPDRDLANKGESLMFRAVQITLLGVMLAALALVLSGQNIGAAGLDDHNIQAQTQEKPAENCGIVYIDGVPYTSPCYVPTTRSNAISRQRAAQQNRWQYQLEYGGYYGYNGPR